MISASASDFTESLASYLKLLGDSNLNDSESVTVTVEVVNPVKPLQFVKPMQ